MKYFRLIFLVFNFLPLLVFSQTPKELKSDAQKLFDNQQFVEATPLYSRLLAIEPKNHEYNFKYGTCLLFQSNDKRKALDYLIYAVKSSEIPVEAYFYLGKGYHINYLFKEAIKSYTKFISLAPNSPLKQMAERSTNMCQNGKSKLTRFTDFEVIDKQELDVTYFYRSYDLSQVGGELIVVSDFQTKIDKKRNHLPLVYFGEGATQIYYASYGDDGSTGLDIYKRIKSKTGPWSEPIKLPASVNSNQDENYPFFNVHTNELYFSSNSYESIGGFDIFKAKQLSETQFSKPTTIDFAISSSEDDFLYISDSLNQIAYFASNRNCEFGKINLYKIKNERYLQNDRLVKGDFISSTASGISITVVQSKTGKSIGHFSSNENKGYYFLFPEPGTYIYQCKIGNQASVVALTVDIPTSSNRLPLVQQLFHERIAEEDHLSFVNKDTLTNTTSEDLFADLIRQKAQLPLTTAPLLGQKISSAATIVPENTSSVQPAAIVQQLDVKAVEIERFQTQNNQLEQAFDYSIYQKNTQLIALNKDLKAKIVAYANEKNSNTKQVLLQEATQLVEEQKTVEAQKTELAALKKNSLTPIQQTETRIKELELSSLITKLKEAKAIQSSVILSAEERVKIDQYLAFSVQSTLEKMQTENDSLEVITQQFNQSLLKNAAQISDLERTIAQLDQQLITAREKDKITLDTERQNATSALKLYQEEQAKITKKVSLLQSKINEIRTKKAALTSVLATEIPAASPVKELLTTSQQQVEANNSTTLQDFIALTVQKNPLPPVSTSLVQKFENEQMVHQKNVAKIQQTTASTSVKQDQLATENKQFVGRLNQLETQLDAPTIHSLATNEQEVVAQLAQRIQQAKDSASVSTVVMLEISTNLEPEISSATKKQQLASAQITQQLTDLNIKSTDKLASIEANNSLEAAEKLQLIDRENQTMQRKEDSLFGQLEQLKNTSPALDLSSEQATLAQLKKDREKNILSATKRIEAAANSTTQVEENAVELSSSSLSTNASSSDTIESAMRVSENTSSASTEEFQRSLSQMNTEFAKEQAKIQAATPEEKKQILQQHTIEWRSQLEAKRATIASATYSPVEKVQFNQLLDSALATIDQQLVQRLDEHKAYLSSLSEDQLQQNQAVYLQEIGVLGPVISMISGKSKLTKEAQLEEIEKATNILQNAQKQTVSLQQKNPFDIRLSSNQFYTEQLLNSLEETQQNYVNELKLSAFEAKEQQEQQDQQEKIAQEKQQKQIELPKQKNSEDLSENNLLTPTMSSLEEESNFIFQLRSSFKSKEILTFNAQQEPALLLLKLAEWKRYQTFLSNQLTEVSRSATKTTDEMERKWITSEISYVQQNITELTRLVGTKTPLNQTKQALPSNSVVRFVNENERLAGNVTYIPMDVELPKGLLYRVQIGAFTQPMLAGNHPSIEPISGERMRNGWYRYMSGYFGKLEQAISAQNYVRQNGFADAYLVAYCDGQKISLQQATAYVLSGTCVAYNGSAESREPFVQKKEEGTLQDQIVLSNSSANHYYEGPNAVAATPIESLEELMYTVQIGAFNAPVSAQITKNLSPIYKYQLPNKHIRYSVGKFDDWTAAIAEKKEVVEKGFKDAFVVAYYKGKRISNQEAQTIAQQVQPKKPDSQPLQIDSVATSPVIAQEIEVPIQQASSEPIEEHDAKPIVRYQFVSKKSYATYPRDVINRYNSKAYFFYDVEDGKVKSSQFEQKESLPRISTFKYEMDTLEINTTQVLSTHSIMLNFDTNHLPGAVIDWLHHLSVQLQFSSSETGVSISIEVVTAQQLDLFEEKLKQFELNYTLDKK